MSRRTEILRIREAVERGDAEGARVDLETFLGDRPDDAEGRRLASELALAERDWSGAATAARRSLDIEPESSASLILLGRALGNLGDPAGAERVFRRAAELEPANPLAWNFLGRLHRSVGDRGPARSDFLKALDLDAGFSDARANLGALLLEDGAVADAERHFTSVLEQEPGHRFARYHRALARHEQGRFGDAVADYRTVLETAPDDVDTLCNLGAALQADGLYEAALNAFSEALKRIPDYPPATAAMAGIYDLLGRTEKGIELLEHTLQRVPTRTPALMTALGQLLMVTNRVDEAVGRLEAWRDEHGDQAADAGVLYTLADLYDKAKRYDEAFALYEKANATRRKTFDPGRHRRNVDRLIKSFDKKTLRNAPRATIATGRPIFIVGMPRSGTSLVEQILCSHPEVYGAGERREFGVMAATLGQRTPGTAPYPECVTELDTALVNAVAREYLDALDDQAAGEPRVTDKMWQNFEHLGLIDLVLPGATVIHCVRHPLDTGLSCFFQSFGTAGPPFSYDLGHIGHYMNAYGELMNHWRAVCRVPILDVPYEQLVEDPETWSRRIVSHAGLEWDPRCLRFYESGRTVRTASHAQVREPVHTRSVNRFRHYEKHLTPLSDVLGERRV